ncbi:MULTISPECIES: flagellar biosynthesis protein FlhA [Variovorax]|jgi:flagellar biosynthesis protein FlhA|uniref:flagellar biosynthesis protein FlhA n=1 Tax=Variovorax TaxID=34072 RepID=UPI0008689D68|nr:MULTISPECIES: flagellar biosynthesis protein FlhA [Variovorax]MBN8757134.1 flagellar biosynthesis protein FlhA [Variovorax sp.]ODU17905.1 MAG: flagellar biosynthesis protein FlhA [Variovorax sp. SCN 67-85]ODV24440.1 MAG: flagellar biosynthesis protein FlhA [Variovorax sp. SCN 67-20]OJZ13620.1 MAG: flagellar biosynthesis protein FlhA [Variovorax sp. 67-131]UKI06277.1 flagellar biosynthesis protein FlhA [Variovorax paradoxus]
MNAMTNLLRLPTQMFSGSQFKGLAGPILIIMILSMMVLPLPPFLLDLLFTFNIAMSVMVLLVSMYTMKALDFAAFPAVLLFSTLLRLSLNVASTRVVLMHGHTGPDAAGKVIEAFGHFLVGGNFAVGVMVFIILVLINFMVITKGAGRIAEVGARFMLDAMPGKQMAIDADLNAGLIGEEVARKRRQEVAQEADFYGSMDGASKFVRGDAIAGLLIMVINIIGGLIVGMVQHGLDFSTAGKTYTLLAIGDGLVAQIPALVISTAAGVIVSRVTTDEDVGSQLTGQLFANPQVLFLTAGIVGLLGMIPGMPNLAFLLIAGGLVWLGRRLVKRKPQQQAAQEAAAAQAATLAPGGEMAEATWDDVAMVDPLGMQVGYRLIPLVDQSQQGELLGRIKSIRKKIAQDIGFLVPVVHIRDNLEIKPNTYVISLKDVEIGRGEAFPNQWMAINPGQVSGTLPGAPTRDPAFGLPAVWIDASQRQQAQVYGYTVVDACTVMATHLNHLIQTHAAELLGRQEVQQLLDQIAKTAPKLTEDLVPKVLSLSTLHKVLQNLLDEEVPIRDMRTILDVMAEHAPTIKDPTELTTLTRLALGRAITQQLFPGDAEMQVIGLDGALDGVLQQALSNSGGIEPGIADNLLHQAQAAIQRQEQMGLAPVLVVQHSLRVLLSRFLRRSLPQLKVLSHAEIPDSRTIKITAAIGGRG